MSFELSRVLNRTFSLVARNPVPMLGGALVFAAVPTLILGYVQSSVLGAALTSGGGGVFLTTAVTTVLSLVVQAFALGALIAAGLGLLRGEAVSLGDAAQAGLRHFPLLILINIAYGLALSIGFALLIVPGLLLATKLIAVLPARVAEGAGFGQAFSRSWELTKGLFWPVFGLVVLYAVAATVIGLGVSAATGTFGGALSGDPTAALSFVGSPGWFVSTLILSTITTAVLCAGYAAVYTELKTDKEGADTAALEETFS